MKHLKQKLIKLIVAVVAECLAVNSFADQCTAPAIINGSYDNFGETYSNGDALDGSRIICDDGYTNLFWTNFTCGCFLPGAPCSTIVEACQPYAVCGNGVVEPGEICDDGNTAAGDGCSSLCDSLEDNDNDGFGGLQDNCPAIPNTDQADFDNDGLGDVCDNDKDGDGFTVNNDINDLNTYLSTDPDADGIDSSGMAHYSDNVCLQPPGCNDTDPCIAVCYVPPQDNCPLLSNPDQSNIDGDSYGDACDIDIDGDSIRNTIETAAGMNPNDSTDGDQAELSAIEALGINKQVPAMGGIGLLALGLSILGLGAVRLRKKSD